MSHNPKLRFGLSQEQASSEDRFNPTLADAPPLPAVNFGAVGQVAPKLLSTSAGQLPRATSVVICWTEAEWAALHHVFCAGSSPLSYSARTRGSWPEWQTWKTDLPSGAPEGWDYWGLYRLVEIQGRPVLLLKSNTHLDFPGASYLQKMIQLLIAQVAPSLIMSTGTAGGAKPSDHVGTVRAISAGTLMESSSSPSQWPVYSSRWKAPSSVLGNANFKQMLSPVPATSTAIANLVGQYNQHYGTNYREADLDPLGLNVADSAPAWFDQTGGSLSLLTTQTFAVGTTSGNFANYAAVEMDDAIIGKACGTGTAFVFVRNLSDPVQGSDLPQQVQKNWGSAVYDVFGFYTSFNGAVVAWAALN